MGISSEKHDWNYEPLFPRDRSHRIGCIGAGFIMADCHLVAYRKAGFNPVAIASRSHEKAKSVAERHGIEKSYAHYSQLLDDPSIEVVDIAVPPDNQLDVICEVVKRDHIRGILAQKPLGVNFRQASEIVQLCADAGKTLCVNQNMRYDQSVRACKHLIATGKIGDPVLATIDMRAIPHWMPWQERQGWVTFRIMSIHHLDTFRFWLGDPDRIYASFGKDPRTQSKFDHSDGICLYILEYDNGIRASGWDDVWAGPSSEGAAPQIGIQYRVEGTEGMTLGTIGWPDYPNRIPSTLRFTNTELGCWKESDWTDVWFPDAFGGPMAELLCSIESGLPANLNGNDNLKTMALVEAGYRSASEKRAVSISEIMDEP